MYRATKTHEGTLQKLFLRETSCVFVDHCKFGYTLQDRYFFPGRECPWRR